ncbi:hypothetical protein ACFWPA_16610 [Rhodococcus sp. NPDC058505]|uniref:hypothetical protein n=1 Tax=unclassified Rhodococcus (in: high G+C Gram-positive bacteria) TaxID=192944 RepID=UPI003657EA83
MAPRTPEEIIELYAPRMPEDEWEAIRPFVVEVVRRGFAPTQVAQVAMGRIGMVTSLVRWALDQGLPLDVEQIFHPATVNRYAVTIGGLSDATRCTRRSTLTTLSRRITRAAPWEPPREALPYPRSTVPYSGRQVSQLLWWAPRQRSVVRRQGLAAAVALGVGAGLRGTEMLRVRASDIRRRGEHVIVAVSGPRARQVPVRPAYAAAVLDAAKQAGGGHLFRDPVPRVEFVGLLLGRCEVPDGLEPVTASRLRLTWEVAMVQAVPLPVFMRMSGLANTTRLAAILAGFAPRKWRRWWTSAELDALAEAVPW